MASSSVKSFDSIVVGSGQAGNPLCIALANSGRHTAIVEATHIGGTCVNEGCTPTKTMVASARAAWTVENAKRMGVGNAADGAMKMDLLTVRRRKRDIVDSFRGGSENRVKNTKGLQLFMGQAKFTGEKEIEVRLKEDGSTVTLKAEKEIFINAGCRPRPLDIEGIEQITVLDSTSVMELDVVPQHLIVVGGGYVGLEFGQMFRRFGAKVTVITSGEHLLGKNEDVDVGEEIEKIMKEDGIEIRTKSRPISVTKTSSDHFSLEVSTHGQKSTTLQGSHLLAATGRIPNTDYLDPSKAGIKFDSHGFIPATPTLETNVPGIYVLGDIKGGPAFTHISYDDFRIIRTNLIDNSKTPASTTNRLVPYTMYTDPQYGRVGHSVSAALALPHINGDRSKLLVGKMPMAYVARCLEIDETRGFMKAIVEKETDKILGFMCLGAEGGEIMSMVQIAMMGGLKWQQLQGAVFAHPTFAEALNNLWGFLE